MPRGYVQAGPSSKKIERILLQLEQDVMADVVRRVKKAGKITSSADWQIDRLNILGNSTQTIRSMLQTASGKTQAEVDALMNKAASETYVRDKALYTASGRQQVSYQQNGELKQIVGAIVAQTNGSIHNITGTAGFMIRDEYTGRLRFTDISTLYNSYLDRNVTAMLSGAFDYNTLIRNTVRDLTSSGLRTVDYASGRSIRTDAAVRTAILTGYGQLTSKVTFSNADQLGTDLFEVTWHPNARPEHQVWQGRVYTRRQLETVCGYGRVDGLCGANCRHVFYPYVRGVSSRQWSDDDLRLLNSEENALREFHGKEYTDYQATQEQRKLETNMKAYLERYMLLEQGGAEDLDITLAKAKFRALKARYKELSKFFGLQEQWERVYTGYVPAA